MRQIYLVFTRDNNQWVNEMVDYVFVKTLPRLFGGGLSTQITRFTGRTFEWYRFVDEMEGLKKVVIANKPNAKIFGKQTQKKFLKDVGLMRELISQNSAEIKNGQALLKQIKQLYVECYPFYALALFVAGPWRDDYIKHYGKAGRKVVEEQFKLRVASEGLLKEITNFMRKWLDPKLMAKELPDDYSKFLTVSEVEEFVKQGTLPSKRILTARTKGFVHAYEKIILINNFGVFIKNKGISVRTEEIEELNVLKGSAAYIGRPVQGKVKVVLNSVETKGFKKGMILVTPMTAPEYLPIMKLAGAIITDEGGITCHAAITARELKIPCIIGTKFATKIFKDDDLVEVDANKGIVRKIK